MPANENSTSAAVNVITEGELAIKESEDQGRTLVQIKDKAQLAATTSMSIVNVALLTQVLDSGRDEIRYYTTLLVLIGTSLALQAIAGILSIGVSNLLAYFKKYDDDQCPDMCYHMCLCWCKSNKTNDENTTDVERDSCCPYQCTSQVKNPNESQILKRYKESIKQIYEVDMKAIEKRKLIEDKDKEIKALSASRVDAASGSVDDIKKALTNKRNELKMKLQDYIIKQEQHRRLSDYMSAIQRNRVMKKITLWQNAINYMLYVVFVMNAFVAGLGLASPVEAAAANTTTV